MFNFFKSSNKNKPSPVATPTEPHSYVPPQSNEEREFVMIEPKDSVPLYPNFNHFGASSPYPARPAPPAPFIVNIFKFYYSFLIIYNNKLNYLQIYFTIFFYFFFFYYKREDSTQTSCHNYFTSGVPFKLSPEFIQNDDEIARFQMNELSQQIQNMSTQHIEYDFVVEREVLTTM